MVLLEYGSMTSKPSACKSIRWWSLSLGRDHASSRRIFTRQRVISFQGLRCSARTTASDVISGWRMSDSLHEVLNRKKRTDSRYRSGQDVPNLGASELLRVLFSLRVFGSHSEDTPSPGPSRCIPKWSFKFNFPATGCWLFERLAIHALFPSRSTQEMTEYHRIRAN